MSGNNEGSNPLRRPMVGSRQQPVQQQLVLPSGQTLTVVPQQAAAQLFSGVVVASSSSSVQLPSSSNSATTYLLQPQQPTSSRSATGGTIHHLGQSPTRTTPAAVLVPSNPSQQFQQSTMNTQHLQGLVSQLAQQQSLTPQQQTPPRASTSTAPVTPTTASASQLVFNSPLASPARGHKRVKLEQRPPDNEHVAKMRKIVEESKMNELLETKENYHENLTELFYLQSGWNYIDYLSWKKKPTTQLVQLLKSATLDSDDEDDIPATTETSINNEVKVLTTSGGTIPLATPVAIATSLPPAVAAIQNQGVSDTATRKGGRHGMVFGHILPQSSTAVAVAVSSASLPSCSGSLLPLLTAPVATAGGSSVSSAVVDQKPVISVTATPSTTTTSISASSGSAIASTLAQMISAGGDTKPPVGADKGLLNKSPVTSATATDSKPALSSVYENTCGSQEAIVERAKQEAKVMQKVNELRKDGVWSSRRLPKVQEPARNKAHWDYLLEEMQWLATDFAQERKWKKAGCRKIARMINRYHQEKQQNRVKAEKEEAGRLKRIAGNMAKMVREFWNNIEKVVEYKQSSRMEEKRKKALDLHLSFIVDQTEKYSSWLTEGFTAAPSASSVAGSSSTAQLSGAEDGDFEPEGESGDDEETIEKEEEEMETPDHAAEIKALEKEGEIPMEELLKTLPKEVLEKPASLDADMEEDAEKKDESAKEKKDKKKSSADDDEEFDSNMEDSDDDEETVEKEEEMETNVNHKEEIEELEAEGELPIEELMKKYAAAYDGSEELDPGTPDDSTGSEESTDEEEEEEEEESEVEEEEETKAEGEDVGMEYLLNDLGKEETSQQATSTAKTPTGKDTEKGPGQITDIAAAALSIQPTGYTLETTQVKTEIPFLLKHTLREYQVVGLDWMATLYDRRLNGILADEMGLGKTIQTIALLAHLATSHSIWGPHLIVVPTSVMLNWEMEFKKWCPAFKILTYYGNQKERKQKRTGWTKTNAFHVCITSYKLVIQDHQAFRRKKWKYFILDEAQNIKNFKSQRWQTLLNFQSQRRLLLTGTPLQNSLMELWSLMHFLMPHVFQSHREFKEWFSNPLTGMIEGSREYNDNLIRRLHKVLRPFLLRRLKADVEKQMPKKFEHIVMCRLSKRQRFLYDDFMGQTKTKETLASGHFMSVINILMQLRKVCNHPNLFDPRPIVSPFQMQGITYTTASLALKALLYDPLKHVDLFALHSCLAALELFLPHHAAQRAKELQTPRKLIEEIDSQPAPPPRPKPADKPLKFSIKPQSSAAASPLTTPAQSGRSSPFVPISFPPSTPAAVETTQLSSLPGHSPAATAKTATTTSTVLTPSGSSQPITVHFQHTEHGPRLMIPSGGFLQIVQTSTGQQLIAASQAATNGPSSRVSTAGSTIASTVTTLSSATTVTSSTSKPQQPQQKVVRKPPIKKGPFYLESLEDRRMRLREEKLQRMATQNERNCSMEPALGTDLHEYLNIMALTHNTEGDNRWKGQGYVHCYCTQCCTKPNHPDVYWKRTEALASILRTPVSLLEEMKEILDRFAFVVPRVMSPRLTLHVSHPPPSMWRHHKALEFELKSSLSPRTPRALHTIAARQTVQFPEVRLIQYDCGKLQTLDRLLRDLRVGSHRVLVFTQMTRMLDILESFLNFHGHRYLRLDGTTKVEQRQALMDRFNMDKRIFVFILSTRSGGIGVNLTGADTVIFYDSDWNPTMDAQAQDRCHRIGQTRDVHIYRLISEKTIEENILKKANQKRMLGDMAIEGGNFTTDFFKEQTLSDLFAEPSGLDKFVKQKQQEEAKAKAHAESEKEKDKEMTETEIEQAMQAAEDEADVAAARAVQAEQKAEVAEFDENIPWDEAEAALKERSDETSKVEQELAMLEKELTSIERFAVTFLEHQMAPLNTEELEKAEEEVVIAKEEWELSRLQALRDEEERKAELEEDEMLYTYNRDHGTSSQVFINDESGEHMPMWCPPTPPQDENDVYVDESVCFLYERSTMPESQLPPVYMKRSAAAAGHGHGAGDGHKRLRLDPNTGVAIARHKHKAGGRKEEREREARVPRSLFDRSTHGNAAALRRGANNPELKKMRMSGFGSGMHKSMKHQQHPQAMMNRPLMDQTQTGHDTLDWLIHEDMALLGAVQDYSELPLNLLTSSAAHIPNWDLVADIVNRSSRIYRSPKQCKLRYENVIIPREEGKILYDVNPRKPKKTKGIYNKDFVFFPTKNNRPMRTSQLHGSDNNKSVTNLHTSRFDAMKGMSSKRTPALRPTLANPTLKNPKHTAVLLENGINYDQPLSPVQVALIRADRIAKEKKASQAAAAAATANAGTAAAGSDGNKVATVSVAATSTAAAAAGVVAGQPQQQTAAQQLAVIQAAAAQAASQQQPAVSAATANVVAGGTLPKVPSSTAVAVASLALSRSLAPGGGIVVNTVAANANNTFATINKRVSAMQQQQIAVTAATVSNANTVAQALRTAAARSVPGATVTSTGLTVQEITAAVVNQSQGKVITTTTLSQAQLLAAQQARRQQLAGAKQITPQQLLLRQHQAQALLKQQQLRANTVAGQVRAPTAAVKVSTAQASTVMAARLQVPTKTTIAGQKLTSAATVTRPMTDADMAKLLKQRQLQQQQQTQKVGTIATGQQQAGQVTRLSGQLSGQLVAGTVQQVAAAAVQAAAASGSATVGNTTSTLVKGVSTVSTPAGATSQMPVTIPVTAVSVGITLNMPQQQKTIAGLGKGITQHHVRQIPHLHQLKNQSLSRATKVTNISQLQQVTAGGKAGATPLILPPQQHSTTNTIPKHMVQQLQKIMQQQVQQHQHQQQQQAAAAGTIQQIITSAGSGAAAGTFSTQLVTLSGTPVVSAPATVVQSIAKLTSTPRPAPAAAAGSSASVAVTPTTFSVKHGGIQEVVAVSPQKTTIGTPQLKTVTPGMRPLAGTSAVSSVAALATTTPSASVQQAVQQVVQQAQAQASRQHSATTSAAATGTATLLAPVTTNIVSTSAAAAVAAGTPVAASTAAAVGATIVTAATVNAPVSAAAAAAAGDKSPYAMRLRNPTK